jgi:lipooligosaccharide transport system permease protein
VPLGFLTGLMFGALACAVTSISRSYEFFNYYFTLFISPMFLFSGVFYPLDRMPNWVGKLAMFLPLSHVVAISRALVRGSWDVSIILHLLGVLAVTAAGFALCFVLMRKRLAE